jgi:hypothetical protein
MKSIGRVFEQSRQEWYQEWRTSESTMECNSNFNRDLIR